MVAILYSLMGNGRHHHLQYLVWWVMVVKFVSLPVAATAGHPDRFGDRSGHHWYQRLWLYRGTCSRSRRSATCCSTQLWLCESTVRPIRLGVCQVVPSYSMVYAYRHTCTTSCGLLWQPFACSNCPIVVVKFLYLVYFKSIYIIEGIVYWTW